MDRAVSTVYRLLEEGKKAATLGPIIHNPQVTGDLAARGVRVVSRPEETPPGYMLVIRSHGVPREVEEKVRALGLSYVDATCLCEKIHNLAERAGEQGQVFLLAGDKNHPEVQGIVGHCKGEFCYKEQRRIGGTAEKPSGIGKETPGFCGSDHLSRRRTGKCAETLKKLCTNAAVFATICNATARRQKEAKTLAQRCDRMVVVGGRDSSNTAKLREICAEYCETYLIERADELPVFSAGLSVGITAGASTPASIIKEVLATMAEVTNNEQNFEEMLEESSKIKYR